MLMIAEFVVLTKDVPDWWVYQLYGSPSISRWFDSYVLMMMEFVVLTKDTHFLILFPTSVLELRRSNR